MVKGDMANDDLLSDAEMTQILAMLNGPRPQAITLLARQGPKLLAKLSDNVNRTQMAEKVAQDLQDIKAQDQAQFIRLTSQRNDSDNTARKARDAVTAAKTAIQASPSMSLDEKTAALAAIDAALK